MLVIVRTPVMNQLPNRGPLCDPNVFVKLIMGGATGQPTLALCIDNGIGAVAVPPGGRRNGNAYAEQLFSDQPTEFAAMAAAVR